ncbi:hypothetical protein, partial [Rhodomicrobium lacus]|uniref:hypothetical protein n=1 Tax=Rhodomicrobium lacus TaxID=2498452 RepID=UPI001AECAC42
MSSIREKTSNRRDLLVMAATALIAPAATQHCRKPDPGLHKDRPMIAQHSPCGARNPCQGKEARRRPVTRRPNP